MILAETRKRHSELLAEIDNIILERAFAVHRITQARHSSQRDQQERNRNHPGQLEVA